MDHELAPRTERHPSHWASGGLCPLKENAFEAVDGSEHEFESDHVDVRTELMRREENCRQA